MELKPMKLGLSLLLITTLSTAAFAENKEQWLEPDVKTSRTEHSVRVKGKKIEYMAVAGDTLVYDQQGKAKAQIFSTAYFRDDVKHKSNRPISFIFNGGPGSSSVWLHMGIFGPKWVKLPSDAKNPGAPPYELANNPYSLLDVTDLVFIDPVGTGYSKAVGHAKGKDFWGVKEDAEVLAEFIRQFITEHKRWNSPKYIGGESYGTTRAGALVKELQEGWGSIDLNGVILISAILDFQTGDFTPGNDLPFVSFLPTYAATAWYHNRLDETLQSKDLLELLPEVEDFTINELIPALAKGGFVSENEKRTVLAKMARYSGLSEAAIAQNNLDVSTICFNYVIFNIN